METKAPFFEQRDTVMRAVAQAEAGTESCDSVLQLPQLQDIDVQRAFLALLESPVWLAPLDRAGFFKDAPGPEVVEGVGVGYRDWPASKYLARVAEQSPEEVASILAGIRTGNPRVLRDILNAASHMPAAMAAPLVPRLCEAINAAALWSHFPEATDFCVQLAAEDEVDAAMTLARTLFTPRLAQGRDKPGYSDEHWYKRGLKQVIPVLILKASDRLLDDLCHWLSDLIAAKDHTHPDSGIDHSDIWRPAIEEHEQNRTYEFAGEMVGFVRQAFEQAIGDGHMEFQTSLKIIQNYAYLVFKRLRVHLINCFAERAPDLAREVMMDRAPFDDPDFKHEYGLLVGRRFPMLNPDQQQAWFGWVDAGPSMSQTDESFKQSTGRELTDEDRQMRVRHWQFTRLHWIRDHLDEPRRQRYEEMLSEGEDPIFAEFNSYHGPVRRGYESPFTAQDLDGLTFVDVVDKVTEWQRPPSQGFLEGPEVEGLAATFGEYVSGKPELLSQRAEVLKGCPPIYVRTFLERMTEAVKAGRQPDLAAVFGLCGWVVDQPGARNDGMNEEPGTLIDAGWQWTRDAICPLIRAVCEAVSEKTPRYPLDDYRESMRTLLDCLTHDPAKSYVLDEAERQNPRVYDFLSAAINSPRGKAVDALLAYARWIADNAKQERDGREVVPDGFDVMPEVRGMLEWQIAPENASFESSAIIGSYVGFLHWIDQSWVERNAPQVFDLTAIERDPTRAFGWAAWNAFLAWCRPHVSFYRILHAQYVYAVEHLPEAVLPPDQGRTPFHRLGEHLVILFGRGDLAANDDEQLLYRFLDAATSEVRSQTIAFVGHVLRNDERVPDVALQRFQTLWDRYWPTWGEKDATARPQSDLFGSWFTCGHFPVDWSLERLASLLESLPIPEFAERILDHLAEIMDGHVEAAMRILDRMVRADTEGWRVHAWQKSATRILQAALQCDETTRKTATQLIDYLGRRGYVEYGELLPK